MYEAREQPEILKELQDNSTTDASKFEGTFEYDMFSSNSIEFAKQEVEREQMYKAAFAETSWGEYLTLRAAEHGITRREATKAIGELTVTGNGIVPEGSLFATQSGVLFHATEDTQIAGQGVITIEAETAGISGNVKAGAITVISMSIPGITAVMNIDATHDGFDEESDAELLERLLFKVRQPATSGNANNYIEWATSVEGVGKAIVKKLWNGNGTVKVLVTDANGAPASSELIEKVATYIDDKHPVGATVTVAAPEILTVNIELTPTSGKGNTDGIKNVLTRYFASNDYDGEKVSYAKVGKTILSNSNETQVFDYEDLLLNGKTDNIPVTDEQIPQVGEVTIHG